MKHLSLFFILVFALFMSISCTQSPTNEIDKYAQRYDTLLNLRGPVKRVAYKYQTSKDLNYLLYYSLKQMDFLPTGERWSFGMTTEDLGFINYEINEEEKELVVNVASEDGMDAEIAYVYDNENKRIKTIQIRAAPEYDGYEFVLQYDDDGKLCGADYVDVTWDIEKNDYTKNITSYTLSESDFDDYGNWTFYRFENKDMFIQIERTIDYYNVADIKEPVTQWEGKEIIPYVEIVGDFNGDGNLEKAWVDNPFDETGEMKDDYREHSITFSDSNIKPIVLGEEYGFSIYNVGDLNNDGRDDFGATIVKFSGAWNSFQLWVSTENNSYEFATSFPIHEQIFDFLELPVRRNDNGNIEIWYTEENEFNEDDELWTPWKHRFMKIKL